MWRAPVPTGRHRSWSRSWSGRRPGPPGRSWPGGRGAAQGGTGEWPARAVVLADGGFQGSPDHLRRYVTAAPGRLAQRGAGTGAGTALSLAAAAGAALVGLDTFYGHLLSRD